MIMQSTDFDKPSITLFTGAKYVCHFCGKNFVSTSNLNKHIKVHGEKNIECEFCGKKFHYPEYLKVTLQAFMKKRTSFSVPNAVKFSHQNQGLFHTSNYFMQIFVYSDAERYVCAHNASHRTRTRTSCYYGLLGDVFLVRNL
jgi:DNA-directed RNA polymerase subunit RPC12/RpoP